MILEKGFSAKVNGVEVEPVELTLLSPDVLGEQEGPSIEPYVFVGDIEGVSVNLVVGFYRPLATEQQIDDEALVRSTRDNAGWTIICNDRVVLYNDKTSKTGWGTAGVPAYHNQFITIAGVVSFHSTNSLSLPLNTTKRGLDTSSDIYQIVLDYMRDGLKRFTSFTNTWKRREEETQEEFGKLRKTKPTEVAGNVKRSKFTEVRRLRGKGTARYYSPNLPTPSDRQRKRRISFTAQQEDIELLAEYYFDDRTTDRSDVGRRCFDESLELAREEAQ